MKQGTAYYRGVVNNTNATVANNFPVPSKKSMLVSVPYRVGWYGPRNNRGDRLGTVSTFYHLSSAPAYFGREKEE